MKYIRKMDNFIGRWVAVEKLGFQQVAGFESTSSETMNQQEWESYRHQEALSGEKPLIKWLRLLARSERRKFYLFHELESLLCGTYSEILELGSGQGHIGILLNLAGMQTHLSEYTSNLLYKKFAEDINVSQSTIDFRKINEENIRNKDCVIAVQFDYIFDSEEIVNFLKICKAEKCDVFFVNTQVIGPINAVSYTLKEEGRKNDANLKIHGYVRSLGAYKKMAREAGVSLTVHRCAPTLIETYYVIGFKC